MIMLKSRAAPQLAGRKNGFTLIELLVVIAIISILASILFPVFARARENARRASCQSNLKQIGLGIQQYTQDYDEKYLPDQSAANGTFVSMLQPYVKSKQIFICPSGLADTTTSDPDTVLPVARKDYQWEAFGDKGHYGMNSFFASSTPLALSEVTEPTITAAGFDSSWYSTLNSGETGHIADGARHLEGASILYADGHVKWQVRSGIGGLQLNP